MMLKLEDNWFEPIKQMRNEEYSFLDNFITEKTYGNILEIGQGGSTVILLDATAHTFRKVVSIDLKFKLKDTMKYLPITYKNRLSIIQQDSKTYQTKEKFGCLLIDGDHYGNAVRKDTMNFWENLEDDGYCIFHDYNLSEDVTKFVDDWINKFKQAKYVTIQNNLVVLQKI